MSHRRIIWKFHAKSTKIYLLKYSNYHFKANQNSKQLSGLGNDQLKNMGGVCLKIFQKYFLKPLSELFLIWDSPQNSNKWEKSGGNNRVLILCITKSSQNLLSEQEAPRSEFGVGETLCASESYCPLCRWNCTCKSAIQVVKKKPIWAKRKEPPRNNSS